jgi:hypothetical protein
MSEPSETARRFVTDRDAVWIARVGFVYLGEDPDTGTIELRAPMESIESRVAKAAGALELVRRIQALELPPASDNEQPEGVLELTHDEEGILQLGRLLMRLSEPPSDI